MKSPTEKTTDEVVVRSIATMLGDLLEFSRFWNVPKGFDMIINFCGRNMLTIEGDKSIAKEWSKVRLKDIHSVDRLSQMCVQLIWATLSIGVQINSYRRSEGFHPINWVEAAAEYDKKQKRKQDAEVYNNVEDEV